MIADFLTDQRERPMTSIYALDTPDGIRGTVADNTSSSLIDLSKIEITKRTKMNIREFYSGSITPDYSKYYQALKAQQRIAFIRLINQLIQKARTFDPSRLANDYGRYGLSDGERIHLNIVTRLIESRIDILRTQKNVLRSIIGGTGE